VETMSVSLGSMRNLHSYKPIQARHEASKTLQWQLILLSDVWAWKTSVEGFKLPKGRVWGNDRQVGNMDGTALSSFLFRPSLMYKN
jgi:hypothetical protein